MSPVREATGRLLRRTNDMVNGMHDLRPDEAGKRRGRRAAAPTGPVRPLDAVAGVIAAWLTAARAGLFTAKRRGAEALAAFRAGPVIPWVSAHRVLVLIGGAVVVSALAIGGTVALIAQVPRPVAGGELGGDTPARPQPGSDFTMPSPVPTSPTPTPTPTPVPTPSQAPAATGEPSPEPDEPVVDPEPTTEPDDPDDSDPPTGSNGRPDPPGATNRPDKPKG